MDNPYVAYKFKRAGIVPGVIPVAPKKILKVREHIDIRFLTIICKLSIFRWLIQEMYALILETH